METAIFARFIISRVLNTVSQLCNVASEMLTYAYLRWKEFFSAGTVVVRQGDRGDKFYIIRGGEVVVTKREEDGSERRVGSLGRGNYFGEQALLHEDRRLATVTAMPPGVECLTLERGYV